jgi:hypothetical protein
VPLQREGFGPHLPTDTPNYIPFLLPNSQPRPAVSDAAAAAKTRRLVKEGKLSPEAVEAVLASALYLACKQPDSCTWNERFTVLEWPIKAVQKNKPAEHSGAALS